MKAYLVLDFDSTLVTVESLDELAQMALAGATDRDERMARVEELTRQGMDGRIGFGQSLTRRLREFEAAPELVSKLAQILTQLLTPSVLEQREFLTENAEQIYVISGGFREYIVPVVGKLGIAADHVLANTFIHNEAGAVVGCDPDNPLAQDGGKATAIRSLGVEGPVIMVGDGYSDYQTREQGAADVFVAFVENVDRPTVREQADAVARDFSEVVELMTNPAKTAIVAQAKNPRV